MDPRVLSCFILAALVLLAAIAGCTSAPAGGSVTTPFAEKTVHTAIPGVRETPAESRVTTMTPLQGISAQLAAVRSDSAVWREAYRMYSKVKETEYVHPPYTVDETGGVYRFDCLGFVDHVLMNANPASYKEIRKGVNPSIDSYAVYFNKLSATTGNTLGWTKVPRPIVLRPGDVCLWLRPGTLDTGHMWIIAGTPSVNPKRADEVLVRIFDSSVAHTDDSRTYGNFKNGLGSGILGMMVDGDGNPAGLYWEGGVSTSAGEKDTTIACGRLDK